MFKHLSDEERKFVYAWSVMFGSVLALWVVVVRWVWGAVASLFA